MSGVIGHTNLRVPVEPELQCVWCGRMELDCICEEIGCLDLEEQFEELLTDEEQTRG